jgi:hypothetical protein
MGMLKLCSKNQRYMPAAGSPYVAENLFFRRELLLATLAHGPACTWKAMFQALWHPAVRIL